MDNTTGAISVLDDFDFDSILVEDTLPRPVRHPSRKRIREQASPQSTGQQQETVYQPLDKDVRVVHQIIGSDSFHTERRNLFCTPPCWTTGKYRHMHTARAYRGTGEPVHNIPEFIKNSGDVPFVVLRYYRSNDGSWWDHTPTRNRAADNVRYDEAIGIVSRPLQEAVNNLSRCVPDPGLYNLEGEYDIDRSKECILGQYSIGYFYHHRKELVAARAGAEGELKSQLHGLLAYITSHYGERFSEVDNLASRGLVKSHDIPLIFYPNETVIAKAGSVVIACVLRAWPKRGDTVGLECWNWGYDGASLYKKHHNLAINLPTQTTVKIRDLEAYPIRFATEEEVDRLEARGKTFWGLRYQSFVAYEGWDDKAEQFYASTNESRWMIDYKTYRQMRPKAEPFQAVAGEKIPLDTWPEVVGDHHPLSRDSLLLLPSHIHGFCFKQKDWYSLLVDNVKPIRWNKETFDRLVLPAEIKDMVKSLVMVRDSRRGWQKRRVLGMRTDLITGKGNGLTMLLHGGPGTGKTLTAESVAELAETPLYSVRCGDIGNTPEAVENYLAMVLMLGKKCNCVLLLQEADIFLEERSLADLERNSLVSVFLRALEHYDGIVILTSNRVGTFDAAFTSRIQVTLHYETLNADSRRKVWQNFFDMLETEEADINDLLGHMRELAACEMNGRQIRNVFTTARQLAIFKKETLTWDHMEQALKPMCDFGRYLRRRHGHLGGLGGRGTRSLGDDV